MRKITFLISAVLIIISLLTIFGASVQAGGPSNTSLGTPAPSILGGSSNILLATINGLGNGEEISLTLLTDPAPVSNVAIFEKTLIGDGKNAIAANMSCDLKDGNYQLLISAPDKYYRSPRGYFFRVTNSEVINPCNHSISFNLIPPEKQELKLVRPTNGLPVADENTNTSSSSELPVGILEPMINLSVPAKQPIPLNNISPMHLDNNRHYFHYRSTLPCPGISARFAVTDPGVIHDGTDTEFVVDHIYAANLDGSSWIEIGWEERSINPNGQRLFIFDSVNQYWYEYTTLLTNPLYVRLRVSSGTTWVPEYYNGSWYQLGPGVDLGFSLASNMFNGGEVYSSDGTHPSLPSTTTDISQLYISGTWKNWDWQRWATTSLEILPNGSTNYGVTTNTNYYNFSLYSN